MAFRELFDCQTLIAEVEKRPGLYDIHLKEYSDRIVKEKLWTEVCEAVITDWSNLSPGKRKERGNTLYTLLKEKHFSPVNCKLHLPVCLCLSVSLYVCMYACTYVCLYASAYVFTCIFVYVCLRVCVYILNILILLQ